MADTASSLHYGEASPDQQRQACNWLRQRLATHFPQLPATTWTQALCKCQPVLQVPAAGQVTLAENEVARLAQQLTCLPPLVDLSPPLYGDVARQLARHLQAVCHRAVRAMSELEATPDAATPLLRALVAGLALGCPEAEQVLAASGDVGRPRSDDELPGSPDVRSRVRALSPLAAIRS